MTTIEDTAPLLHGMRRVIYPSTIEVRDVDTKKRAIEGRAVPYNTPTRIPTPIGVFTEIFEPGVFGKIRETPLLLFHDNNDLNTIIGVSQQWIERRDGLHGVWRLDNSDIAQRAARMADNGILTYLSVGFMADESVERWEGDDLTVIRRSARLLETSLVSTPAYPDAQVLQVRHLTAAPEPGLVPPVAGRGKLQMWKDYLNRVKSGASV